MPPQPEDDSWRNAVVLFATIFLLVSVHLSNTTNRPFPLRRYCEDRFTMKAHEVYWKCAKQNPKLVGNKKRLQALSQLYASRSPIYLKCCNIGCTAVDIKEVVCPNQAYETKENRDSTVENLHSNLPGGAISA